MANIIGEPLSSYVVNQINTRQKVHGSGTPDNPRTPEYLSYLNSKTAWIKMASGVAIKPERLAAEKDSLGNSIRDEYSWMELAKNFVLFDGVSRLNGTTLTPRGTSTTANNVWDWYEGTYNISSTFDNNSTTGEFGLTPMPGIESVDVKCQNRGSTKKVSVKLKCYSPEQFKIIDLLYLRIGYTMFIEWGWNPYMEDSSNMVSDYFTLIEQDGQGFFDWTYWKSKSYLGFLRRIEKTRAQHRGNYDGILCRVTNFSWTFSQDGSYDISIELISLGDVVESIKTNITPSYQVSKFIDDAYKIFNDDYDEEETKDAPPSSIDNIISAYFFVQKLIVYDNREKGGSYKYWEQRQIPIYAAGQSLELCSIFVKGIASGNPIQLDKAEGFYLYSSAKEWLEENHPGAVELSEEEFNNTTATGTYYYIYDSVGDKLVLAAATLGVGLTSFANPNYDVYVKTIIDPKDFETDDKNPKDIVYFNYNTQEDDEDTLNDEGFYIRFGHLLSYIQQFVIPRIEGTSHPLGESPIINIDSGQWSNKMYTLPFQVSLDPRVCIVHTKEKVNSKEYYTSLPVWKNENKGYAYPMNIYLSFNKINELISSNLDEEGNLGLFDFISSICTEVNKALGGINNLEPVIDEVTNTLKIIDGSYSLVNQDPGYALEIFGYNSNNPNGKGKTMSNFVRNFSIKTEITNDFATMASVGSTAGGYVKGTENTMFSKWNKGLIDRFKEKLIPGDKNSRLKAGETPEASEMYYTEFWNRKYSAFGLTIPADIEYDITTGDQPSLLPEAIDRNVSVVTEFYKYCQSVLQEKREKYASPTNGFIPISLGLTLDGISGIKIYNALNVVTRVLPQNYPNSLKFIVKGVNHKISQNDWETSIETVVIAQNEDKNKSIFTYEEIYNIVRGVITEGKAAAEETTFEEVNNLIRNLADGTSPNESDAPSSPNGNDAPLGSNPSTSGWEILHPNYPNNTQKGKNIDLIIATFKNYGVTNPYAIVGALSVIGKESEWIPQNEILNYSKERLPEVWGAFSTTGKVVAKGKGKSYYNDLAAKYERNPEKLANFVYGVKTSDPKGMRSPDKGTKKSNPPGSVVGNKVWGDGYKYRGRGFNQITWKATYEKYGKEFGVDLVKYPDKLNEPELAAKAAVVFFRNVFKAGGISDPISYWNKFTSIDEALIYFAKANSGSIKNTAENAINLSRAKRKYFDIVKK